MMNRKALLMALPMMIALMLIFAGTANAHGSGNTADGPDAGTSIQVHVTDNLWGREAYRDAFSYMNSLQGPNLDRVAENTDAAAELHVYIGRCYLDGEPFYGGLATYRDGEHYICLTAHAADGSAWTYTQFKRLSEHEHFHKFGALHHTCADIANGMTEATVMNVCEPLKYGITQHDINYLASL